MSYGRMPSNARPAADLMDANQPDGEAKRTDVPIRQRSFYGRFSFSAARFPAALALASHMNSPRFVFPQLPLSAK
jgi:hypothetical protein